MPALQKNEIAIVPKDDNHVNNSKSQKLSADNIVQTGEYDTPEEVEQLIEDTQLTFRALFFGTLFGAVITVSNLYNGLKTGWVFGASQFAALLSFAAICTLKDSKNRLFGGKFTAKENCTAQTAGSAAGAIWGGFTGGIPALFWLGILNKDELNGYIPELLGFTIAVGYLGLFLGVPLRTYSILKQKLVFPTGTATAYMIKSLHESVSGTSEGMYKAKLMSTVIAVCAVWAFIMQAVFPGIWTFDWYGVVDDNSSKALQVLSTYTWFLTLSPTYVGSGMIMGMPGAASFFVGAIVAFGIFAPTVWLEQAYGVTDLATGDKTGADFFVLWSGITLMIFGSITELLLDWKVLKGAMQGGITELKLLVRSFQKKKAGTVSVEAEEVHDEDDPAGPNERILVWMWSSGFLAATLLSIFLYEVSFGISWWMVIITILITLPLVLVGVQSTGLTDTTPVSVSGKVVQLAFAGIAPGNAGTNLWTASLTAATVAQACGMLQDLKAGHILRASPRLQFIAQCVGTTMGVIGTLFAFILFATAYPCILEGKPASQPGCPFPQPISIGWYAVAKAVQDGISKAVPIEAMWAALISGIIGIVMGVLRKTLPQKYAQWIPIPVAMGLAFCFVSSSQALMFFIGAVINMAWHRMGPISHERIAVVVASGMIAGEGIGGLSVALVNLGTATDKWAIIEKGFVIGQ